MPDMTAKLTNHGDRVRAVVECAGCGTDMQVSGDTFAEAEEKLTNADGYTMARGYVTRCPSCEKPATSTITEDDDE